jgi:hypothetical protein
MNVKFGPYIIKIHELDNKLSIQVVSDIGTVVIKDEEKPFPHDFPNGVHFQFKQETTLPKAKGLKRYEFGDYTFILGINNVGQLCLYHSIKLYVNKKIIDGIDTLTFAFLINPKD